MITNEESEAFILLKYIGRKQRYVGGRHSHIRNIAKGRPPEDRNIIERTFKNLCKRGWIVIKPTKNGIHVSLNPKVRRMAYDRLMELGHVI